MALIECVPNISEGRDPATIRAIADAMRTAPGARVLHVDSDADHHRSVITVAGSPFAVAEAAFFCAREAAARIDLSRHDGVHPRHGAVDVVPFVPLTGATMAQCVAAARTVGARIRDELGLPVQYYGHACPDATSLPELRRRERPPGSVAVGARPPLIAFNVNLDSQDVDVARSIATAIRESDGGLPAVRALGFELTRRGCVQVALNLVDWTRTSPARAYAEIERLAREAGVAIRASEVVGMIPRGAVAGTFRDALECERLEILETDETFLDALAADSSTPAGGAAAAHTGAVAAALV
ncbi:MAG: glutamate formimidoyltransferase, partial [Planctomycetota bacterium]|nr:glutamate formimidoyltransferase [Planctomycetota bacterium]